MQMRYRIVFGVFGLCSILALAADKVGAPGTTWPVFRGSADQVGVVKEELPARLEVLWTFKAEDAFEGAVAIAGATVFAGSMDEKLYAIDLAKGSPKWKYKGGPFKAPVAVRNGLVYAGDLDGNLHCVSAAKGDKSWVYETGAEVGGANFHGEDVLVASHDEHLHCIGKDGKRRWAFKTDGPIYGCPAVVQSRTFLVGCDSQMHVIDVKNGKEVRGVELGGQTGATAAVRGEMLYIGTMRNEVKAIDWKKGQVRWTYKPRRAQAFFSSPAVTERLVVIGCRDNKVHAIDRQKGTMVWTFPTGDRVDSSPVVAGTKVVAASLDGNLYVLDLATGKQLQKLALFGKVSASPVVAGGKVLIGTQKGTLYCLGAKK
jgi:outer membrane protein assembly factor BamB